MASSLALKRATSSLYSKLVNPIRSVSVVRSLNTNAQLSNYGDDERGVDVDRRSSGRSVSRRHDSPPSFFSGVFDPFSPKASYRQILNLVDRVMDDTILSRTSGGGSRMPWNAKEDDDALYLRMDMPGLAKEHVKVSVEQNTLIIKGEGEKESEEEARRVSSRIDLPEHVFKLDEIKAEMKNGVLKVVVPKVKEDQMKNVREINVE